MWSVGFRPFFPLAMLAGALLPWLWLLSVGGAWAIPTPLNPVQWHAHEMFYGFGWAVLGGFLLTATKNWVRIRGYHGAALALLVLAWLCERAVAAAGGALPGWATLLGLNLFLPAIVIMLVYSLVRYRERDGFADNYYFLIVLPLFIVAKNLLIDETHAAEGITMTLGLFRVAFLVMLERTLGGFMQGTFGLAITRDARLDGAIKGLAVALVGTAWWPTTVAALLSALLAGLLLWRFFLWHPKAGMSRLDIGIMYLGYLGIVLQLLVGALPFVWVGSVTVHLFSFGVMGLIIPAMLVRISKGHTGRPVRFEPADHVVLYLMMLAFASRLIAPQLWPGAYLVWLVIAALAWSAGFALLFVRYVPFYLAPRADGKPV